MRVIMLIEVNGASEMDAVNNYLGEGVEHGRIAGFSTLVVDGQSQAKHLPALMASERNLCDWIAPMERIIKPTVVIDGPDAERFNAMQD